MQKPEYANTLKNIVLTTSFFSYALNVFLLLVGNNDDQVGLVGCLFLLILLVTHFDYFNCMYLFSYRKFKAGYSEAKYKYKRYRYLSWLVFVCIIMVIFVMSDDFLSIYY